MDKTGTNNESMQSRNRTLILQILAKKHWCSRVDLANWTGLTQAAISKIISEMIDANVVVEGTSATGRMGRRTISISLNTSICQVLAVKIARKSFDVAVFRLAGDIIEQTHSVIDVRTQAPKQVVERVKAKMNAYLDQYPDIKAIGIAVPGPYLRDEGRIAVMSEYSGWNELDLRREFQESFSLPIVIEHDTTASVIAEWNFNDHYFYHKKGILVSVDASEGFGAGVMNNGEVLLGANGAAGEIGHMSINMDGPRCVCGNYGCLEGYCSALAFAKNVEAELENHPESTLNNEVEITAEIIFQHMERGDQFCIDQVKKVGRYFGYGLANVAYIYNPNEIVITDIMSAGGDVLLNEAIAVVRERTLPPLHENLKIRMSTLKYDHILMGAAALATDLLMENPGTLITPLASKT